MSALSEGCFFKNTDPYQKKKKKAIINKTVRENRVIIKIKKNPRLCYLIILYHFK